MKAIHLTAYGNPEDGLQQVDINEPTAPGTDQVLIEMEYSPVNLSDLLLAMGVYAFKPELPTVIGGEGVGKIIATGGEVTHLKVGDRVTLPFGTFAWAQKVVAPAAGLFVVDPAVDVKQAAMLTINPATAVLLLSEFVPLKKGDWVLFNAANSAVGHAIVAVAKSRGIKTAGIVRRQEAADQILKAGADVALVDGPDIAAQMKEATGGANIQLGLDAVGGEATNTLAKIIGNESQIVVYALMSHDPIVVNQGDLVFKKMKVHGFWMYYDEFLPKLNAAMEETEKLIISGDLDITIAKVYALSQIKEAAKHALSGGKVLLDFNA